MSVCSLWGGGGSQVQVWGGPRSRSGGGPRSRLGEGGVTGLSKGKNFWHQIWLDTCSDWKKIFLSRAPPPSKGKNFWHQIWLDTCSDWQKKYFVKGPPPRRKGKNFWHQIWLDTCSDWQKKYFVKGPPPPAQEREKFLTPDLAWYMFRLGKKIFVRDPPLPRNSKDLLWLRGGRYASCVHAGGLSCLFFFFWSSSVNSYIGNHAIRFLVVGNGCCTYSWEHDIRHRCRTSTYTFFFMSYFFLLSLH